MCFTISHDQISGEVQQVIVSYPRISSAASPWRVRTQAHPPWGRHLHNAVFYRRTANPTTLHWPWPHFNLFSMEQWEPQLSQVMPPLPQIAAATVVLLSLTSPSCFCLRILTLHSLCMASSIPQMSFKLTLSLAFTVSYIMPGLPWPWPLC